MTIGTNIKRLRQHKGVTQEQLGEVLGISGQAVVYPIITEKDISNCLSF